MVRPLSRDTGADRRRKSKPASNPSMMTLLGASNPSDQAFFDSDLIELEYALCHSSMAAWMQRDDGYRYLGIYPHAMALLRDVCAEHAEFFNGLLCRPDTERWDWLKTYANQAIIQTFLARIVFSGEPYEYPFERSACEVFSKKNKAMTRLESEIKSAGLWDDGPDARIIEFAINAVAIARGNSEQDYEFIFSLLGGGEPWDMLRWMMSISAMDALSQKIKES